jgi:hypothetical protein
MNKFTVSLVGVVLATSMGAGSAFAAPKGLEVKASAKAAAHVEAKGSAKAAAQVGVKGKSAAHKPITCAKVPPGHLIAPGFLKKQGKPVVPPCQILPLGIKNKMNGTSTTTPPVSTSTDATAPVISGLSVSGVGSSSATISWATNEAATGNVYFGTSTPVGTSTAIGTTTLSTAHSFTLNGLSAATTYRFFVESKDAAGNRTTTAETSFTTAALDTTAPVISAVALTKVDATTARIDWNTSEVATGKVYFAPTSTVDLATAANVSTSTLSTNHSLTVSGVATGTIQFFVIESLDAYGNKATTTAGSLSF